MTVEAEYPLKNIKMVGTKSLEKKIMIKKLDKYSYGKFEQINDHGPRNYGRATFRAKARPLVLFQLTSKTSASGAVST